jgi:ABC-2 type transport system permease protein
MSHAPAAPHDVSADRSSEPDASPGSTGHTGHTGRTGRAGSTILGFVYKTYVIAEFEVRKLLHDPTELATRAVQPALWLLIFGEVFTRVRAIPTGGIPYLDFMAPGILAQSVLFVAIFYGIAAIWERDLGTLQKLFVSPTPRAALVLGKAVSAGIRSLSQVVIIYALAFLLGVDLNYHPLALLGVCVAVLLGAACFATLSLIIAAIVKTRERFMGIGQVITMPLFFASNAIYPLAIMPPWLKIVARVNPLSYEVDALRALMITGGTGAFGLLLDFGVLTATTLILIAIGTRIYPELVR